MLLSLKKFAYLILIGLIFFSRFEEIFVIIHFY
jgi:hypothetical protein